MPGVRVQSIIRADDAMSTRWRLRANTALLFGSLGVFLSEPAGAQVQGARTETRPRCEGASVETLENVEGVTLGAALQGRIAGVVVSQVGGAAGSSGNIRIRGTNSLLPGNPLIFVDGVRITQVTASGLRSAHSLPLLEFVDPFQISHIEVLRGPAATIQYGADAANGIIRIYTKRGGGPGPLRPRPLPDCPAVP
jgi:outer membrane receptor protein involved in Fe transport